LRFVGLDWIGLILRFVGLDWIGLRLRFVGLDWIGIVGLNLFDGIGLFDWTEFVLGLDCLTVLFDWLSLCSDWIV
jgi:hypothetical protein